ncbi:prohibitin family protein [Glaciimonas sp. GNP009]
MTSNDITKPGWAVKAVALFDRMVFRNRFKLALFSLVFMFIMVMFWDLIVVPIPAGFQGVYWSRFFGGTCDFVLPEGTALKLPWDEIAQYDMRMKEVHQTATMLTKDGLSVQVTWSTRFRPDSRKLPELHKRIGPDYKSVVAIPEVVETLRREVGSFRADQVYDGTQSFNSDLSNKVLLIANRDHIPMKFDDIVILKFELPEEVAKGIQIKLLAEQNLLAYVFKLQAEQQELKRKGIEAEGIKEFEATSGISILKWRGIDATVELAKSPNTKIIIMGTGAQSLPLLLNSEK